MGAKQTVLVIEDDYNIRHLLETILSENGYVASGCETAEQALKKIPSLKPSLLLLDIQLPGINGLDLCKKIRSTPGIADVPIILVSVNATDVYKITGLEAGADDFISKPFSHGELLSRVKAVLRRTYKTKSRDKQVLKDHLFSLDLKSRTAVLKGKDLALSPKEFDLLALFLKSHGEVISRDTLAAQIWEHENLTSSRTIDVHIGRLRKKLGNLASRIETKGKVGYRYNRG